MAKMLGRSVAISYDAADQPSWLSVAIASWSPRLIQIDTGSQADDTSRYALDSRDFLQSMAIELARGHKP